MPDHESAQAAAAKRVGERAAVRTTLLDAAEQVISEEGYAAATVRRIAGRIGLKHQVIFYYFGTQEDLLLAVFRRRAELRRNRLVQALHAENPIRSLWEVVSDPAETRFFLEFMALASHSEVIRAALAENAEHDRALEVEALDRHFRGRGIQPRLSPQLVSILTTGMARALVQEAALGISSGHREVEALVSSAMKHFEMSGMGSSEVEVVVAAMAPSEVQTSPMMDEPARSKDPGEDHR